MPYKHPSGVMCPTLPEFFAKLDETDGNPPGTAMAETFEEMDRAMAEQTAQLKQSDEALFTLVQEIQEFNQYVDEEDRFVAPEYVLQVLDANSSFGFRDNCTYVKARAVRSDGYEGCIVLRAWRTSGSMYEPPDGDTEVAWDDEEGFDKIGPTLWWQSSTK